MRTLWNQSFKDVGPDRVEVVLEDGQKTVCMNCLAKIQEEYDSKKSCKHCIHAKDNLCNRTMRLLQPISINHEEYYIQAEKCSDYMTNPETEIINSYKCPNCSKEIQNIHCTKCGGEITKSMKCFECGAQITFGVCPHCKKLMVVEGADSIDWKKLPKPLQSVASSVVLENQEEFLAGWNGNRETIVKTVGNWGTVQTGSQAEAGILCLSNRKLIWVGQRGSIGKSWVVGSVIPLEEITGISSQGSILKLISISTKNEEYRFHLRDWINKNRWIDHESFAPFVNRAIQERGAEIEKAKKKDSIHLIFDFGSLQEYMKNGGLVMQNTKCPQCGGSVKVPEEGNQTTCDYCGANIKAEDIFKKIKELIG